MALVDDLIALGKQKLLTLQGIAGTQDEVKKQFLDLVSLKPEGLSVFTRASVDIQDFAEKIDANRKELRPWVMVYPAAMGLEGPWSTVLNLWCRRDFPNGDATKIDASVRELLESSFSGYTRLIAL